MTPLDLCLAASVAVASFFVVRVLRASRVLRTESPWKKASIAALRTAAVVMLLLALFDVRLLLPFSGRNYIVLLDNSFSMKEGVPRALRMIRASLDGFLKEENSSAQYATFAAKAGIEKVDITRDRPFIGSPKCETGQEGTNLENALTYASALSSPDSANAIILFSDGEESSGDYRNAIGRLRASGISVYPFYYDLASEYDVLLTSLSVPPGAVAGQKFEGKVVVELKGAPELKNSNLRVYRNGSPIFDSSVTLTAGFNTFPFLDSVDSVGFVKYSAHIEDQRDKNVHNNTLHGYVDVSGPPGVLLLSSAAKAGPVKRALSRTGFPVTHLDPSAFRGDMEELLQYRLVVLNDVPARALSRRSLLGLKSYVNDMGGGLLMLGGDESFGNGGYMATPLEDLAPVTMDVRDKGKVVSCAIVFIIDKSGSMSEMSTNYENDNMQKVDLAKEAVISAVNLLLAKDYAGVIAFDDQAKWVVTPTRVTDPGEISNRVSEIVASGGTSMYGALQEAFNELRSISVTTRHAIVLTDGITAPGDFREMASAMLREKITLSSVALGRDADVPFLQDLASAGGGRFYYSEDASDLPSIFVQETLKSSRKLIVEEEFAPVVTGVAPVFKGLSDPDLAGLPSLRGYVATTIKPSATMFLKSHKGDPLIASIQCGLGRTVGVTFDLYGRWSSGFLGWPHCAAVIENIARHLLRQEFSPNITWKAERDGENLSLVFRTRGADRRYLNYLDSELSITAPDGSQKTAEVSQVRPGTYAARYRLGPEGTYFFSMRQTGASGERYHTVSGVSYPYSNEFAASGRGKAILEDIAARTGGAMLDEKNLYSLPRLVKSFEARKRIPIRDYLLQLVILVFLLEIFLWRVDISADALSRIAKRAADAVFGSLPGGETAVGERSENMNKLLAVKGRVKKTSDDGRAQEVPPSLSPSGAPDTVGGAGNGGTGGGAGNGSTVGGAGGSAPVRPGPETRPADPEKKAPPQAPGDDSESFTKRLLRTKKPK